MRLETLINAARHLPTFGDELCVTLGASPQACRLQLSRWTRAGKIIRLKRGLYTLPPATRPPPFSTRWLGNTLYSPSYLSLETMLSWYDLIPERVTPNTSVTTLKTAQFQNALGMFVYRHIKPQLFTGFEETRDEHGAAVLMATPEKALLDYIYLYPHWQSTPEFVEENVRLQQIDQLRRKWLLHWSAIFQSKKMDQAAQLLIKMMGGRHAT